MRNVQQTARQSVLIDATLLALVPLGLNVLRLLDPNGSKLPGTSLLLIIIFKNLLYLPAVSLRYEKIFHKSDLSSAFEMRTLILLSSIVLLTSISILRGLGYFYTFSNALGNITFLVASWIALVTSFLNARNTTEWQILLKAAPAGLVILVITNLVAFAAGKSAAPMLNDDRLNQTLSMFGITVGRVFFPLSAGVNGFGSVCAIATVSALVFWVGGGIYRRAWAAIVMLGCFGALVAADSRAAIAGVFLACLWLAIAKRYPKSKYLPLGLIALSPFLPLLLSLLFSAINHQGLLSGLIRTGTQGAKLGIGSGREYVWSAAAQEMARGDILHLIGFGAYGQAQSTVSAGYAWVFNELGRSSAHVHNTALQYFFDMGYIGTGLWIACFYSIFSLVSRKSTELRFSRTPIVLLATLVLLVWQSQTEVVLTTYTPELFFYFMIVGVGFSSLTKISVNSESEGNLQPIVTPHATR